MLARAAWNAFRQCWSDTYLGPPAFIVHDPRTNFSSREFRDNTRVMGTQTRQMPVEAYNLVGLVERYYIPLKRAYNIFLEGCPDLSRDKRL